MSCIKDGHGPCTYKDTYTFNKLQDLSVSYCDCNESCKYYWEELDYDLKDYWC